MWRKQREQEGEGSSEVRGCETANKLTMDEMKILAEPGSGQESELHPEYWEPVTTYEKAERRCGELSGILTKGW